MEFPQEVVDAHVDAYFSIAFEDDALFLHQPDPPGYYPFLQFEVGDTIAQEASRLIIPFKDRNQVAGSVQLVGGGQSCGSGTDNGYFLTGPHGGLAGFHEAFFKCYFNDMLFNFFDGDRWLVNTQDAAAFAGGRADAAGEFRKII